MFALLYRIRETIWAGYLIPLPACLLALAAHTGMVWLGAVNAPFLPFLPALLISTLAGGVWAGMVCIFIAGIFTELYIAPFAMAGTLLHGNIITALALLVVAVIMVLLIDLGMEAAIKLSQTSQAMRRANETLEARVAERSAELMQTEEQLRQAQKMEAVGQLTGGIAHDFNNLLTGILGGLERLQCRLGTAPPEELARYINAAQDAAGRASTLTHRLLAFSRRQPLNPRAISINSLTAGMTDLIARSIGPLITLEVRPAAGLHATLADPNQLEHALLNLCINASDAMPNGGTLRIRTANCALGPEAAAALNLAPGDYVTLTVEDTGTGMPPEVLARVFDPFFTTKPIGQGTGLGLSMIYGFTRQSGGHVAIASAPGQGTRVTLYLPRHGGPLEEAAPAPAPIAAGLGQGEGILLVDDEPSIRLLAAEVLGEQGYSIHQASSAAAALDLLQSATPITLLITDIGLPGMNGSELASAALILRPELKILFITGYAENAQVRAEALPPSMRMLTKPFALSALPPLVQELLGG